MHELPLSKFAPFTKEEAQFQYEVSNKLDDIGVKCSNCIYFGEPIELLEEDYNYSIIETNNNKQKYSCNILSDKWGESYVCENSLCRFFTNKEEIIDSEDDELSTDKPDEELSIAIQKLDFTNSKGVKQSIKDLREKLINEN